MELNELRKRLRIRASLSLALKLLMVGLPVFFILLGYNASPLYYWGILSFALPLTGIVVLRKTINSLRKSVFIKKNWGGDAIDEEFGHEKGRCYFEHVRNSHQSPIDDQTCNDLNLHDLYKEMNTALTVPGKNILYALLRTPLVGVDDLRERGELIEKFQTDVPFRERILTHLLDAHERKHDFITDFLWNKLPAGDPQGLWYKSLALTALCSLITPFLVGLFWGIALILLMFFINLTVHTRKTKSMDAYIPAFTYLRKMLSSARRLAQDPDIRSHPHLSALAGETEYAKRIIRTSRLFSYQPGMAGDLVEQLLIYVRIFFLVDLNNYNDCLSEIGRQTAHLKKTYELYGYIDAIQSIASFRHFIKDYAKPVFIPGSGRIKAEGLFYPLLDKPVSNSVVIDNHGMIITGTNMAGKSTFLRTVGLNCLLAQTCLMCFAAQYEGDLFVVMSSINKKDDVGAGVSFYYHEAKRIFDILTANTGGIPLLCLIDELLSGTNSLERVSASIAILKYLTHHKALVIAATHDVKIALLLKEEFRPCHFTDQVGEKGLEFSYKIKEGIVETTNAIRLLERIGYPDSIIREALELKKDGA